MDFLVESCGGLVLEPKQDSQNMYSFEDFHLQSYSQLHATTDMNI